MFQMCLGPRVDVPWVEHKVRGDCPPGSYGLPTSSLVVASVVISCAIGFDVPVFHSK